MYRKGPSPSFGATAPVQSSVDDGTGGPADEEAEEEQLHVVTEPSRRASDGTRSDLDIEERRGWLSHGIAALAVSALGLAVAGSVVLTTNAQTTTAEVPARTTVTQANPRAGGGLPQTGGLPGTLPGVSKAPATADVPALAAFSRRGVEAEDESRSSVRSAIVEERAAQRSEDLTQSAEDIAAAALERSSEARKAELAKSDRARRVAAIAIAQERTRKAIQARVTAEVQRELAAKKAAEAAAGASTGASEPAAPAPTEQAAPSAPAETSIPSGGGAASPVPGAIVGASFGATGAWARYHTGLDFRAGFGTPIRAVTAGVVTFAGNKGNWAGNHVAIRHAGGYSTMSSHMQSMAVNVGESVQAGQVIGYVGSTGRSFGAHLHFEVYPPGVGPGDVYSAINPLGWLRAKGVNTN